MAFMKAALVLIFGFVASAHAQVLLNEVAPGEAPVTGDWVEIFVAGSPANLSGWKVYEQNTLVKTFPEFNFSFSDGTYLILHFNSSQADEDSQSGDLNDNGAVDIYTSDTGLTGTSNVLTLRNSQGLFQDAVVFSDNSSWTRAQQSAFDLIVSSGHWVEAADSGSRSSVNIAGGIGAGHSIGRGPNDSDSNSASEWNYFKFKQTPGFQNFSVITCPTSPSPEGAISEIAPSLPISSGGDFVEIYIRERADICGMKVLEGLNVIKIFPPVTPNSGPFGPLIVLHASIKASRDVPDETELSGDLNGNGVIDLYSDESSPGLTGSSDNSVSLEDRDGRLLDFLPLADRLPLFGQEFFLAYDRAALEFVWSPPCGGKEDCYVSGSFVWPDSSTKSISRKAVQEGEPRSAKPSTVGDWEITPLSPGKIPYTSSNVPRHSPKALHVTQSPFSPLGDGLFREAQIHCSSDEGAKAAIWIFDIQGRKVRTLAEHIPCFPPSVLSWDGRDSEGGWVPSGIYIVWIEIKNSGGDFTRSMETVVVGRKL